MSDRLADEKNVLSESDRWIYGRQTTAANRSLEATKYEFDEFLKFYRQLLADRLPASKSAKILDLPCGEGRMIYALRALGYTNITGYDLDRGRLATGQQLGLPLREGNVFDVLDQAPGGSIGAIIAMDFLEHLDKIDVIRFLELATNRLASGGMLLVRLPCANSMIGPGDVFNDFTHKWGATTGLLAFLLKTVGLHQVAVFGDHPTWGMPRGWLRVPLFLIATGFDRLRLRMLGRASGGVWSTSMWGIGYKP